MNKLLLAVAAAALLLTLTDVGSQEQTPNFQQALQSVRLKNAELIARQKQMIEKLDELEKTANEIRIRAKRT